MHRMIVMFSFLGVALSAAIPIPQQAPKALPPPQREGRVLEYHFIPILRQSQDIDIDGSYNWGYETGNGIFAQEQAVATQVGPEEVDQTVQGEYKYTSPEGEAIFAKYIADKLGFRIIEASHLPTPPPIPPEILKSLEHNAAHPEEDNEGQYDNKPHHPRS